MSEHSKPRTTVLRGDIWRSPRTWWRIGYADAGTVHIEGPRGSIRTSTDGGTTWSGLFTTMTAAGFQAWIRKSHAVLDEAAAASNPRRPPMLQP